MILSVSTPTEHQETFRKEFTKTLASIINEHIIPMFGMDLKFSIQLGLWTSDEYGSYKVLFADKKDNEVCYIIADTIQGKWEVFKL